VLVLVPYSIVVGFMWSSARRTEKQIASEESSSIVERISTSRRRSPYASYDEWQYIDSEGVFACLGYTSLKYNGNSSVTVVWEFLVAKSRDILMATLQVFSSAYPLVQVSVHSFMLLLISPCRTSCTFWLVLDVSCLMSHVCAFSSSRFNSPFSVPPSLLFLPFSALWRGLFLWCTR
jgi:hypothetical protein